MPDAALGEYSHHLLYLRLEETAAGSAIAMIVIALVIPLTRGRVFAVALDGYLEQLENFLRSTTERQTAEETAAALRSGIRAIDASYQTVVEVGRPRHSRRIDRTSDARTDVLRECLQARNAVRAWAQDSYPLLATSPAVVRRVEERSQVLATQLHGVRDSLLSVTPAEPAGAETPGPHGATTPASGSRSPASATADAYLRAISSSVTHLAQLSGIRGSAVPAGAGTR